MFLRISYADGPAARFTINNTPESVHIECDVCKVIIFHAARRFAEAIPEQQFTQLVAEHVHCKP
jgi:hypothetical protein